jgi:hypothetical protein
MKNMILALTVLFSLCFPVQAETINHCKDPELWKEWDVLIQKHPHNSDIQMLHAVRIGLCKKIEDGSISLETAIDAFDELHDTVYKRSQNVKEQWLKDHKL